MMSRHWFLMDVCGDIRFPPYIFLVLPSLVCADPGVDSGYCLMVILIKYAPIGSNCFCEGISIQNYVGADPGADPGY